MSLRRSIEVFCAHRRTGWLAPLVSVGLCLPALGVGYQIDDWMQQAMLRGLLPPTPARAAPTELFSLVDGGAERHRALLDLGILPWWTWPDLQVRFFRPFSALGHALDHALAPGSAMFAHLHSLLWLGALVAVACALYRRIHGPGAVAGLAGWLYAVDEAHGIPVGWLANRNALVCCALGTGVILLHDRGRRDGSRPGRVLAPLLLALALASGEAAVAVLAWLVAYTICLDTGSVRARVIRLAPFFAVTVIWRRIYRELGYGTHGSGVYIDPVTSPVDFLAALPARTVLLLSDQLLSVPGIAMDFLAGRTRTAVLLFVIPPLVGVLWMGGRALRGSPEARFWALGALLSILPVASVAPAGRLLGFVGLGGAALVAMGVDRVLWRDDRGAGPRWLAWALLAVHGGLAAILLPTQAWVPRVIGARIVDPCDESVPDDPGVRDETVVFVNSNDLCVADLVHRRQAEGRPRPAAVRLLASALYDIDVRRLDAHTLQIDVPAGMQSTPADRLHRLDVAMPVGSRVAVRGMTVEITSWNDEGRVDQLRARFDRPLDDPSLRWMGTVDLRSVPLVLPEEGGVLHLPGAF